MVARNVEYEIRRKHELPDLFLPTGEVQRDVPADILRNLTSLGNGNDGFGPVAIGVEALSNVEVIEAPDRLPPGVLGWKRVLRIERAVEGRETLLAVEDQVLGFVVRVWSPFERPPFEDDVAPALELHEGAHWIALRETRNDVNDSLVVPCPVPLELGKLQLTLIDVLKQALERSIIGFRCGDSYSVRLPRACLITLRSGSATQAWLHANSSRRTCRLLCFGDQSTIASFVIPIIGTATTCRIGPPRGALPLRKSLASTKAQRAAC